MLRPKFVQPRGVLHKPDDTAGFVHARYWPSPELAPFVEHFWTAGWDLAAPRRRETLPHPCVFLLVEGETAEVAGPTTKRFTREFSGAGRVFAAKFLPGGFHPFTRLPVSAFAERALPLAQVFGESAHGFAARVLAARDDAHAFALFEDLLRSCEPVPDATIDEVVRIVRRIAQDREIRRIEQIAAEFGIGVRSLQRMFREYVGVSPKWVIQRYRLHELVERLNGAARIDWAATALDLGYADQAHLIRDFRRLVGRTPTAYRAA
ncbi:MAG: helix-turn-helix domain-containing protein [Rudaea sp.]